MTSMHDREMAYLSFAALKAQRRGSPLSRKWNESMK